MTKSTKPNSVDAQTIFSYAEAFAEAADRLREQAREIQAPTPIAEAAKFAPMTTLDSFALELYLKCLHVIDHGKAARGHDFKKLFGGLTEGMQKAVRTLYNIRLSREAIANEAAKDHPRIPLGLDSILEMSKTTFETMRYLYEKDVITSRLFYWPMVRLAVRDTILAIYPAWKIDDTAEQRKDT